MIAGQLKCLGVTRTDSLVRYVENQLREWVENSSGVPQGDVLYDVAFQQDADLQRVTCSIELSVDSSVWRGFDLGSGPWSALAACLHRLKRTQEGIPSQIKTWRPEVGDKPQVL